VALKEGESSGWVFEVEVLEECGGLIMGSMWWVNYGVFAVSQT